LIPQANNQDDWINQIIEVRPPHGHQMIKLMQGDCTESLKTLPDKSVNCCVTSPPYYGLRSYNGGDLEIGTEKTPEEYITNMVKVFAEVKRVLRDDGTCWINISDSYAAGGGKQVIQTKNASHGLEGMRMKTPGIPAKNLIGIPWMLAFALRADGWFLRQEIIWAKPNPMPESVKDRCTKSHESIFLLSKQPKYYFDAKAIEEPAKWKRWGNQTGNTSSQGNAGRFKDKSIADLPIKDTKNKRSVWTVSTKPCKLAHFAVFPPDLIEPCILAGCPECGTVIDPFGGSGTVAGVAIKHNRKSIICELNNDYHDLIPARVKSISGFEMLGYNQSNQGITPTKETK